MLDRTESRTLRQAPIDRLLPCLQSVKRTSDTTYRACCPAHDDAKPSLDIKESADGKLLLLCRSQRCSAEAICQAVGLKLADLFPANDKSNGKATRANPKPKRTYDSLDAVVKSLLQSPDLRGGKETRFRYNDTFEIVRFDFPDGSKTFRPVHRVGDKWSVGDPPGKLPLYRVSDLSDSGTVYIAEGEKPCDAVWATGIPCVTSAHGSQSPQRSDWAPLAGKGVVILPDHDEPGQKYGETVAATLARLNCKVRIVELPGLGEGEDVVNFIEAHNSHDADELRGMIEVLVQDAPVWKPGPIDALRTTDLGLAEHFVRIHAADFRYCKGMGWLAWDGKRFVRDDLSVVVCKLKKAVLELYHEVPKLADSEKRKKLVEFIRRSEKRSVLDAVDWLASSDPLVRISADRLDCGHWLFNCENGTLDLRTGQLRKHRREDLITKLSPARYDPNAQCPIFTRFLSKILPSESLRLFAQRSVGYALTGLIRQHVLHLLWGTGANGKSTFINAVLSILGDYGMMAAPKLLMARKHEQHPTELADLFGKRFIASLETGEGRRLDEELVKRLSGGDRIKARLMRKDFFEFDASHKLFLATNHRPNIRGTDDGIWRRIRLWPFTVEIPKNEQDVELSERLLTERPGILAWAVRGCLEWQAGGLTEPDEVLAATASFRAESDTLGGFIDEHCVIGSECMVASCDLYESYKAWAAAAGEHVISLTRFGKAIKERGFRKSTFGPTRRIHYFGLGLGETLVGQNPPF